MNAQASASPRVTAIILNTNRREDTLRCLASLTASNFPSLDIMVLDNACTDGSAEAIARSFPQVRVMPLVENKGYAGNNNAGIQQSLAEGADWVLVLNEDTTMAADMVSRLVAAGESDACIGVAGPLVYHGGEPTVVQSAGMTLDQHWRASHLGQNQTDEGQFAQRRFVDGISGCAILLRSEMLRQIGGFDERFFYYYEETELCFRASRAGWKIIIEPAGKLWHTGVQRDYRPGPNVTYYNARNHLMMLAKHRAPLRVWLHEWWDDWRTLAAWTLRPKWRDKRDHRDALLQGMLDFLRHRVGKRPV